LLLAFASAVILRSFYCLRFETPPTWWLGPRIYVPQEHGGLVIPQASYDSQGCGGGIRTRLHKEGGRR
jgi:hypothetical protein